MNFIGYSSAIAGDEVFEWVQENYGAEGADTVPYDLSYFFGENKSISVKAEDLDRQISAQYPTVEVIERCAVMQYFDDETNAAVNEMWEEVKGVPIPLWAYIVIIAIAAIAAGIALSYLYKGKSSGHKPKKGYRILKEG